VFKIVDGVGAGGGNSAVTIKVNSKHGGTHTERRKSKREICEKMHGNSVFFLSLNFAK
jgi:uncharacterized FAD-dependent dehydrogenase